jgi:REP element-mobilizing transposase RayT
MLSRRCSERRFFLKPCKRTRDIFLYALALYAQRYRIQVHAFCVMSNHHHLALTDTLGLLPDFARDFHALIARSMNHSLDRWEGFWDRDSYSGVRLVTRHDVLDKLVYILANPVAAGLVRRASDWPGPWSDPRLIGGKPLKVRRPVGFFDEDGNLPEVVELQLVPPRGFEGHSSFVELLLQSLAEAERLAIARIEGEGHSFLGLAGVLSQSVHSRPATYEPRRQLNPRVACRGKWKRIETLQRLKGFVNAYKAALAAWRRGLRDALFPPGTWHMRVVHAARCVGYG